ncbi:hypothetical protein [Pelagibacterium luteolum]|uniref:Uncharacterized protein n=1 Tax=Pelagibacterium luteolum TaxID=440168 RepID=A0A1G7TGI1_9HYPH|nr:hypothetical protein [Pelagibacterium luteolum]SDG34355.1 hypothetical protein SAMN04487974_102114 [Pelagibacterium luteolum]
MKILGYLKNGDIDIFIGGERLIVPDVSSNRHRRMITEWEAAGNTIPPYVPPAPAVAEVKAEANRRITYAYPLWRQINIIRDGGDGLADMSAFIDGLRAKSNKIEAMKPIPPDFRDDKYW